MRRVGDIVRAIVRCNTAAARAPRMELQTVVINSINENEFGQPFYGCKNARGKQVYFTEDKIQQS